MVWLRVQVDYLTNQAPFYVARSFANSWCYIDGDEPPIVRRIQHSVVPFTCNTDTN